MSAVFFPIKPAMTNDHAPQKLLPVLLKAGALGVAILLGFLLGIMVGDRDRRNALFLIRVPEDIPVKNENQTVRGK